MNTHTHGPICIYLSELALSWQHMLPQTKRVGWG